MVDDSRIKNKSKSQILSELKDTAIPGTPVHEQQKIAIIVRCVEDLEKSLNSVETSMNKNADSSQKLANKVFYLSIILTIATILGSIIAIANFFIK